MKKIVCRIGAIILSIVMLLTTLVVVEGWSYDFEDKQYKKVISTYDDIPDDCKQYYSKNFKECWVSDNLEFVIKDTLLYHI